VDGSFTAAVADMAFGLATHDRFAAMLAAKNQRRATDEARKPLATYRDEELSHMRLNFFGFDSSYHVARYNFVHKVPHSRTPLHLAPHRKRCAAGASRQPARVTAAECGIEAQP